MKATAGAVATALVNLASDVTGILPVGSGGTGLSSITGNRLLYTNSTGSALLEVATSSVSYGLGFTPGGTFGALVGGSSPTLSIATSSLYSGTTGQFPYFSGTNTLTATSSLFLATSGNVGIGTTTPWRAFSLTGTMSSPQFALAYDATRYAQLQTDASGDLSLTSTGGNTRLPDNNLFVCTGGACPTVSLSGTGNLTVENKITVGSIEQFCPTGYVWVPGLTQYGTLPGFCTMKYEAKNSGGTAVSVPGGGPWVSIDQPTARAACEALGTGYHLITESEWMTIATQVATLAINDLDADAALQLATGHSDNAPAAAQVATTGADPVVSGCNLLLNMEDASNAYVASSCEIRGDGSYGGDDNDKGYYGTSQAWATTGYSSGAANKAQLRTAVLPNGAVLWDIAGNVWEWTDAYVNGTAEKPTPVADTWAEYTAITNYVMLNYARPKNPSWASANGIGQYNASASAGQRAFLRGGGWGDGSLVGVFALLLAYAPSSTGSGNGFRCSR